MNNIEVEIVNGQCGYAIGSRNIWTKEIIPDTPKTRSDIAFYQARGVEIKVRELNTISMEAPITEVSIPAEEGRCAFMYPTKHYCKNRAVEGSKYCEKHTETENT